MIQFLSGLIAFLIVACVVLFLIAKAQVKRADKARAEAQTLHKALGNAEWKAERLQKSLNKQNGVEVKANEQKQELSSTTDADLVHRANKLFDMQNH
jgi:putative AlgH/UPF0301 family transcriptional regulator